MKIKRICEVCGKEFEVSEAVLKQRIVKFCSRECYYIYLRAGNSHLKKERIKRICKECGREFEVKASRLKTGRGRFCSRKCKYEWLSKFFKGKNSPCWKPKIKCICEYCKKEFEVIPSRIEGGNGKFCSRVCKDKWQSENMQEEKNHFFGKSHTVKTIQKIREARMKQKAFPKHHTNPELIFEEICKKNNLPFHFVGDGSLWIGKKKSLNPDFCELNGKKIVIEIFGDYWHSPLLNYKLKEERTLNYRKQYYRRYKWQPIFLWESDLKRSDAEQFVLNTLQKEGAI